MRWRDVVGNTGQSRGLHGNGGSVGEQAGKVRRTGPGGVGMLNQEQSSWT